MFEEWGFLIAEMVLLIILAALLGLLVGWIIWGRRGGPAGAETDGLKADLAACRKEANAKDTRIASLEGDLAAARNEAQAAEKAAVEADQGAHPVHAEGAVETTGVKPAALDAPREGGPDDLKQIKGIGPKLEKLCHALGFYHFDQIANWTAEEIAWVDANLEGFKGRVTRDDWVQQAGILAAGGNTAFASKVKKGDFYE